MSIQRENPGAGDDFGGILWPFLAGLELLLEDSNMPRLEPGRLRVTSQQVAERGSLLGMAVSDQTAVPGPLALTLLDLSSGWSRDSWRGGYNY